MNKFTKIFLLLIMFSLITACNTNPRVQSNYDASLGLSDYQTYNFSSPTEIENPDISGELQLYFSAAVEKQMLLRGLVRSNAPDILINVLVDLENKTSAPIKSNFCPRYQDYYSRNVVPIYEGQSRPTMCVYKEGSIKVEMVNAELKRPIFEGVSRVRLDENDKGPDLIRSVLGDVATMFGDSSDRMSMISPKYSPAPKALYNASR